MSGKKMEPRSMAINPKGVSQIGQAMGNHAMDHGKTLHNVVEPVHAGRGFAAPHDASKSVHHSGSQKRHG